MSSPALGSDSTIYVGSEDTKLYAIYTEGVGLANSPWPKFKHDNQNSGNYLNVTSIKHQNNIETPKEFSLYPLYPNPFNHSIKVRFTLPEAGKVDIDVYNVTGQYIGKLLNENKTSGTYFFIWDASKMPSGSYFIRFKSGNFSKTRKCLLVK